MAVMTSDEHAIREWLDQWLRASSTGDSATMLRLLADDVVFIVPGQPPFGKQEFKSAWDGPMRGSRIDADADMEECLVDDSLACTRTRLAVTVSSADGKESRASGYTLSVFRKEPNGRWLLARDANLLTREK